MAQKTKKKKRATKVKKRTVKKRVTKKSAKKQTKTTTKKSVKKTQSVTKATAERLRKAGYSTTAILAQAQPEKLAKETGLKKYLAERLISSAKDLRKETSQDDSSAEKKTSMVGGQNMNRKTTSEALKDERFRNRVIHYVVNKLF